MVSNGHLRTYQILVFMVSGAAGLVVSVAVGWTSRILQGECVLYSSMTLTKQPNGSLYLNTDRCKWGEATDCSFSTFCPVGVTIYCVIWIWFYIFLSDWGTSFIEDKSEKEAQKDKPPPDQHLLIPSIVCNVLVLGLLLAVVAIVEAGRSEWCENIQTVLKEACHFVGNVSWENLKGGHKIYRYLNHARVACWVLLVSMAVQTVIIFIRLRRNSRRPRSESYFSEEYSDAGLFYEDDPEPDSEPEPEPEPEPAPPTRKRLQRQKKVVIVEDDQYHTYPSDSDWEERLPTSASGDVNNVARA